MQNNQPDIPATNKCLTQTCKAVLQYYKKGDEVPDKAVNAFGDCVIRAIAADFPFHFWREEHPDLAAIVDTETLSAQSLVAINDIGHALLTVYLPVFWFIKQDTDMTDAMYIRSKAEALEKHIGGLFPGIDPLFTPYPVNIYNLLSMSVRDAQARASDFLMQRYMAGNWDATRSIYDHAMGGPAYQVDMDARGCVPTVYEVKLYGTISAVNAVVQKFDQIERTIPDSIMRDLMNHPDVEYYHADEWILPTMLIGGMHIHSAAIAAAWLKFREYQHGHYQLETKSDSVSLKITEQQDSTKGILFTYPYCSSMSYPLQSRLFFQWFLAHLARMENSLIN